MRAHRPSRAVCRAVVAVAALYALVLQAVLGGMAVPAPSDPAHVLCTPQAGPADGLSKPDVASDPAPDHAQGHLPCCTAAHPPGSIGPPLPAALAVVWPVRRTFAVVWRPEAATAPRAPPRLRPSARAPPVA